MKKISLVLLMLCMAVCLGAFMVNAADTVKSGSCGENASYVLDSDGLLTITGSGKIDSYPWRDKYSIDSVKKVIISHGITDICDNAFNMCDNLTAVTLPDTLETIDYYAFSNCPNLKNIVLPQSLKYIGTDCFRESGLTAIVIPHGVETVEESAFYACTSLSEISVSDTVTHIGSYAFFNTAYYEDETNWENGGLYINNHLISTNKSEAPKNFVIKEGTVTISPFAFSESDITDVYIPDSVRYIGKQAFAYASCLTSVVVPEGVTEICDYAFYKCTSLSSITLPDSITKCGEYILDHSLYIADSNNWEGNVLYVNNHLIKAKTAISGDYTVRQGTKGIFARAFSGCTKLTSITLPEGVVYIGNEAFSGCKKLENINLPNGVAEIGEGAFSNCGLTSIKIPSTVTVIKKSTFYLNEKMTSVEFSKGLKHIEEEAFYGCRFSEIEFPEGFLSIGQSAFAACISLNKVVLPESFNKAHFYAFHFCSNISVYITDLEAWMNIVFSNKESNPLNMDGKLYLNGTLLTDFVIPESETEIGQTRICSWETLKSVTFLENFTSIALNSFISCPNLSKAFILSSDVKISQNAFSSKVILYGYPGSTAEEYANTYGNTFVPLSQAELTVKYHVQGGSPSLSEGKVLYGNKYVLHNTVPEKDGFEFFGWASEPGGTVKYFPGDKVEMKTDITLYAVWKEIDAVKFKGTSLILDGAIGVKAYVYVDTSKVTLDRITLETFVYDTSIGETYHTVSLLEYDSQKELYYTITHIFPKDADNTEISYKLTCGNLIVTLQGVTVSECITSLKELAKTDEEYMSAYDLVCALETYLLNADRYFNGGVTADVKAEINVISAPSIDGAYNNVKLHSTSLLLEETLSLRHYFVTEEDGVPTFEVNGQVLPCYKKDGLTYVDIKDIAISDADEIIILSVSDAIHVNFSVLNYIQMAMQSSDNELENLMSSLYNYYYEAEAYLK